MNPILISNSFPFSLVRRRMVVEPRSLDDLKDRIAQSPWQSVWGHANTVAVAGGMLGVDLHPKTERPAIEVSPDGLPSYAGQLYTECWLLSPNYTPGFRPQVGEEVPPEKIAGWQVLRLVWPD
jgi:hypothetical protein